MRYAVLRYVCREIPNDDNNSTQYNLLSFANLNITDETRETRVTELDK